MFTEEPLYTLSGSHRSYMRKGGSGNVLTSLNFSNSGFMRSAPSGMDWASTPRFCLRIIGITHNTL